MSEYHTCYTTPRGKRRSVRLYGVWRTLRQRCENKNNEAYVNYGHRGISVCSQWSVFSVFREWALSSGYRKGLTIERKDNDGNYNPENCIFATYKQQAANKRPRVDSKLTYEDAVEIRKDTRAQTRIAKTYGVSFQMISFIKNGRCWVEK